MADNRVLRSMFTWSGFGGVFTVSAWPAPRPTPELAAAIDAVIGANGDRCGRIRVIVTGGPSTLGSERLGSATTVLIGSARVVAPSLTTPVVTVPWRRNGRGALVGLKTTSYAENVKALAFAHLAGASEAIFLNTRDELCEGSGSTSSSCSTTSSSRRPNRRAVSPASLEPCSWRPFPSPSVRSPWMIWRA